MAADPEVRPVATERDALLAPKHDDDPETAQDETLDEEELDEPKIPGVKIQYILPALALGIFLAAMDNTIVVSSYGAIGNDLKELNRTSWIATAYLLTTTSFQPLYGKLSDIFGRKASLLFAYAVFGIGCLACGMSMSLEQLVAARAFAGIGGGGMTTVVSILVSDIVGLRSRGTWQGVLNIVFASGAAAGAPLGGIIADTIGWRWAFILQFPATLLAIAIVSIFLQLPAPEQSGTDFKTRLYRVDFLGAAVLVLAVLSLLIGLDKAGNLSLTSPVVITSLSIALALFATFTYVESFIAAEPFAPPHVVKQRTILASCLANFFSFASHMTVLFFVPLYYQAVEALSARQAGMRLLPAIAGGVSGSLAGGLLMQKTGKYYWLTVSSYCLPVLGSAAVLVSTSAAAATTTTTGISFGILSSGFGNGIGVTTTLVALIAAAGSKDQAVATAVSYLFRALGTVSGVSLGAMLVQGRLRTGLERRLGSGDEAAEIVRRVRGSMDFIATLPDELRAAVRECYRDAVHVAFGLSLLLAVCAVVSSVFIREKRLAA
ncbi:major facilitator superfamily domain-containing protein [Sphaerosporella brunnea]|uniref:Major facilitator superfamily domain-containing protein n=1 Tax=Sphaerosporella brunnea TaxID=1250544 RepID=A0A5J5EZI3_9PEZI|nr:major facilitator superfamily domain-containing protein [Sphaerosporella brunnea]